MSKEFGSRISKILSEQHMSQKDLANRLNVSEGIISRYISGNREPKPDMLANIATALKTTSDYLLGIETDEFSYLKIKRMIARNAQTMSSEEKKDLINVLFWEV